MTVSARMQVTSVTDFGNSREVKLVAVYSSDPTSPNYSYSKASPSGELKLMITNPEAYSQFKPGETYDITFNKTNSVPS